MKSTLLIRIAVFILALFALSIWSGMVRHVSIGGDSLGIIGAPVKKISEFPSDIKSVFEFILSPPETYVSVDTAKYNPVNNLNYDCFILNSMWNSDERRWEVYLINLRTNEKVKSWILGSDDFQGQDFVNLANVRPKHSLMLADSSLIIALYGSNCVARYSKDSELMWKNEILKTHHSINPDYDGNVWICADELEPENNKGIRDFDGHVTTFRDNNITKYDSETGEILANIPVSKILFDNNLEHILYHSAEMQWDPIHLNDVQPALEDGKFWKKGDLFLSLRNASTILLYRPSTNKVLWHKSHFPLLHQHDVDILDSTRISIFNNNHLNESYRIGKNTEDHKFEYDVVELRENPYNQMLEYDFSNDEYSFPLLTQFTENKIGTPTEGLLEVLPNGDVFVENQNNGIIHIISKEGIILEHAFAIEGSEDLYYMTNWIRVY